MKPLIGITTNINDIQYQLRRTYTNAINNNGGISVLLPMECKDNDITDLINKMDGLILSGGGDINSIYFNQKLHEKADLVLPIRDEFELELCKKAISMNKPILAICRGMQILNVALGGQLHQHIENHQFSKEEERDKEIHSVNINKNSKLYEIVQKEKIMVNSIHHQAVSIVSDKLVASSESDDHIIESIEMPNAKFVIGVQWHPEILSKSMANNNIFKSFIEACKS